MGCSPEDLLEAMNDREKWRNRVRDLCLWHEMMMMIYYERQQSIWGKLDGNWTWMLQAVLNRSWRQHPTKRSSCTDINHPAQTPSKLDVQDLCDTAGEIRVSLLAIYFWGASHTDEQITYLQQLCTDTGGSLEDLLGTMDGLDEWQERFWEIRWWWWYILCNLLIIIANALI